MCTFFGHHDCPPSIKEKLRETIIELIEHQRVDKFYVGNKGTFDSLVRSCLRELVQIYPHISYAVVLERVPLKRDKLDTSDYSDTMVPEGIEQVHPRYAISWRNQWMIRQADYVLAYVNHSWGGAARFTEVAKRQKKTVIIIT